MMMMQRNKETKRYRGARLIPYAGIMTGAMLLAAPLFWISLSMVTEDTRDIPNEDSQPQSTCHGLMERLELFNPFTDLKYSPISSEPYAYSSYQCTSFGTRNESLQSLDDSYTGRRPHFVSRTCFYRNLYYRTVDQTFHYLAAPAEAKLFDLYKEKNSTNRITKLMQVSLGHVQDLMPTEVLEQRRVTPWAPVFHGHPATLFQKNSTISRISNTNALMLLFLPFHSMNVGHFVWDDLLSLFSLQNLYTELFSNGNKQMRGIPLFVELSDKTRNYGGMDRQYRCNPRLRKKWRMCVKTFARLYPPLFRIQPDPCSGDILRTGNWLGGSNKIGLEEQTCQESSERGVTVEPLPSDFVLLPFTMAGVGRLGSFSCEGDCAIHRGTQLFRFRNFLLDSLFGARGACELEAEPMSSDRGYLTFSLPVGSSRPDEVSFFAKEIELARERYGNNTVQVVDMSKLTIEEQARLVLNTAVFISNHGGGSFSSIFLRKGSSVLLYWHGNTRFDHNFFEPAGYLRVSWISRAERGEWNRTMALIESEMDLHRRLLER